MIIDVLILTVMHVVVNEMSDSSTPFKQRNIIFQVHCGRWEQASVLSDPGNVLKQLLRFNWKHLKEKLGITHIYFLGLWENDGKIMVDEEDGKDISTFFHRSPSPFAITDHCVINPDLGTAVDMHRLLICLHALDLKVVADFIPNHTGHNHRWVIEHPEYYQKGATGLLQTAFSGDVIPLDYSNTTVEAEMIRVLEHIADFGFDGVRCDMAHLIPLSFWSRAINRVSLQHPDFCWIAEAYSQSVFDLSIQTQLMEVGFDAVYNEPLYRNLKTQEPALRINNYLGHYLYVLDHDPVHWLHYVSNHDDNFPLPEDQFSVWLKLTSLLQGWLLIYNGSLWGRMTRLAHHWIELLPKEQIEADALSCDYVNWFTWLASEQPGVVGVTGHDVVGVSWQGKSEQGKIWFNLSGEKRLIGDTKQLLDPYQVMRLE